MLNIGTYFSDKSHDTWQIEERDLEGYDINRHQVIFDNQVIEAISRVAVHCPVKLTVYLCALLLLNRDVKPSSMS